MTETTTEAAATATEVPEQQTAEQVKPTDTVEFWKTKAREQEARAKANATAAARLKEFEDRDKSEAEKVAERAAAAEQRATQAESRALRLDIAFEKGLTPAQAKRLVGTTREELEQDADEVLRDFPVATSGKPAGQIPQGYLPPAPITDPRARDLAQIDADLKAGKRST